MNNPEILNLFFSNLHSNRWLYTIFCWAWFVCNNLCAVMHNSSLLSILDFFFFQMTMTLCTLNRLSGLDTNALLIFISNSWSPWSNKENHYTPGPTVPLSLNINHLLSVTMQWWHGAGRIISKERLKDLSWTYF